MALWGEQGSGRYHAAGLGGRKANSNIETQISKDLLILFLIVLLAFSTRFILKIFKYSEKLKN